MTDGQSAPTEPMVPMTIVPAGALEMITRAEIETQVGTARKFRRSLAGFRSAALTMATLDQETAAACTYMLPRDKKTIEGPSIRLAEIVLATWGNLRAGSRLIAEDDKTVTAQGFCHDLENNVAVTVEQRRKITNRFGTRYSDDMVNVTAQAACAIALRNAIFKVIPLALVEQIRTQAMRTAAGDETTLAERRSKALAHFGTLGVSVERVLARLAEFTEQPKTGVEDVTLKDMAILHGFATSLRDGVATVEELFPVAKEEPPASKAGALAEELKGKKKEPPK